MKSCCKLPPPPFQTAAWFRASSCAESSKRYTLYTQCTRLLAWRMQDKTTQECPKLVSTKKGRGRASAHFFFVPGSLCITMHAQALRS